MSRHPPVPKLIVENTRVMDDVKTKAGVFVIALPTTRLALIAALLALPLDCLGIDLIDAYRQARASDPVIAMADATRRSADQERVSSNASLLPNISISAGLDRIDFTGVTDHRIRRSVRGSISQTLFDQGKVSDLRAARSRSDAQDATYHAAAQELFVRVTQAYFNALTSDDALAFARANERAISDQLKQAQARFDVGLSAIIDVYDAQAQHDSAVADVLAAETALSDAREALTQITGSPADHMKKLREELPLEPPQPNDAGTWVDAATQYSPSITAARHRVDAAEHGVRAARAAHMPTIEASVSYEKTTPVVPTPTNGRGVIAAGATFTLPLFSGGAMQARIRKSIHQRDGAMDSLEQIRRSAKRTTLNAFRSVVAGISQVKATRASVISSQSARDATQAGFGAGTRTIVDVLIAQRGLTQSRSNYSRARHQFVLNKLMLKQSAGTLDIEDLEAVNALLQ
jgi:outer membrane protein